MQVPEDKLDLIIESIHQMNQRFDDVNKRLDDTNKRIDNIEYHDREFRRDVKEYFKELRDMIQSEQGKLQEVYEKRDQVAVNFTRSWAVASFSIAVFASMITFVGKAFLES